MVHKMRNLLFTIFVLGLGFSGYTHAAAYKWIDEKGNVVYSQTPPPENDKQYERMQGLPKSSGSSSSGSQSSSDALSSDGSESQGGGSGGGTGKETTEKALETRQKNCEIAKKNLELYTTYRRFPDKDGNMTRMDDDERLKKIQESEQQIQEFCE